MFPKLLGSAALRFAPLERGGVLEVPCSINITSLRADPVAGVR